VENYFFAPRITARTMELHPATAFGAALAGAALLGPVGAVLALPAAAMMQAFASEWGRRYDVIDSHLTNVPSSRRDLPPREHATTLANVASALDGLGRFDEAYATYQRALGEFSAIVPPSEFDIAILLNNLAYLQDEMGRNEEAVASQQRSVELNRKLLGPENPDLAIKLGNLAARYLKVGRLEESSAAIAESLQIAPHALAADDQKQGNLHAIAAKVALARGDRIAAMEQARRALAIYDRAEALEPGRREKAKETLTAALALGAKADASASHD